MPSTVWLISWFADFPSKGDPISELLWRPRGINSSSIPWPPLEFFFFSSFNNSFHAPGQEESQQNSLKIHQIHMKSSIRTKMIKLQIHILETIKFYCWIWAFLNDFFGNNLEGFSVNLFGGWRGLSDDRPWMTMNDDDSILLRFQNRFEILHCKFQLFSEARTLHWQAIILLSFFAPNYITSEGSSTHGE